MLTDSFDDSAGSPRGLALLRESLLRLKSSASGSTPPSQPLESFFLPAQRPEEIGRLAHYSILRLLGEGGMGRVYEAEDQRLERRLALKILLPIHAGDSLTRERFLREARILASVSHPHIVGIFDVGVARGSDGTSELPYLAMELLQGESLESAILRRGALPPGEAVRIARETAEGLVVAHDKGLIHRDIKPANLWLESPRGSVKILDFGLARMTGAENTRLSSNGQMIGTPSFMSPEQARGENLDARADLFSLGCVLYTILAGEVPFDGPSVMAVLTRLAVHEPSPLAKMLPDIAPDLSDLVSELLAKDRRQRPDDARAVIERLRDLEAWTTSEALTRGLRRPTLVANRASTQGEIPIPMLAEPPEPKGPAVPPSRRQWLLGAGLAGVAGLGTLVWWWNQRGVSGSREPIRVGVLHSASGTMRASETPVMDMTQMALEEIHAQGGLLGRPVKILLGDGASNERVFASEATRLIQEEKVVALFGCWTSASRKAVKSVVEGANHLLFYPVQYEGLEQSPRIVYTGAAPNQQLLPAAEWCVNAREKRSFFLMGSDYIFPRTANELLRHHLKRLVGPEAVVGEEYIPLGSHDVQAAIAQIKAKKPQVILNTINGESNATFFQALKRAEILPQSTLIVSFSLDEQSMASVDRSLVAGTYTAWNYFAALPGERNQNFKERYQRRYGAFKAVTDPMEAAWLAVQFWAQAVLRCQNPEDIDAVLRCVASSTIDAPEGPDVRIDPDNQHTWKYFRIGQITPSGTMRVVHQDDTPTRPEPYPKYRTRAEWHAWQMELYRGWGDRWSAPSEE